MAPLTTESLRARIDAIKNSLWSEDREGRQVANKTQGAVQSTLAILRLLYGDQSHQITAFMARLKPGYGRWDNEPRQYDHRIAGELEVILDAAMADFESGITLSVRIQAKGEVLGDFLALAREALASEETGSHRVAAVLAAAALEETLKELGAENGVDVYRRDFRGVVQKLKEAGVLTGAQPGLANGYSTFRDHAFHGQFDQIERGTTNSAIAFVEGILASRFS